MKFGDTIPTGTYLDMAANLPIVDPKKVLSPVLMLRGVWDGNSTNEDLLDFYTQLPNGDRQFVDPAEHRAQPGLQQEPAPALVYAVTSNFCRAAGIRRRRGSLQPGRIAGETKRRGPREFRAMGFGPGPPR